MRFSTTPCLAPPEDDRRFERVIGEPMAGWDGIVHREVIDTIPNEKLVYSWKGGSGSPRLDSTVTWTLTPVEGCALLKLVHAGFRSPQNDFAFNAMSPGWNRIMGRIAA
jgi:uncharacterized protein YndB with AHSA1/START domain